MMTPAEMRAFTDELASIEKEAGIQYLYGAAKALGAGGRKLLDLYRAGAKKGGWQGGISKAIGGVKSKAQPSGGLSQAWESMKGAYRPAVEKAESYGKKFAPKVTDKVRKDPYSTTVGRQGAMLKGLTTGWAE
jgi:hypothetical protein